MQNIFDSLAQDVRAGTLTLQEAAEELASCNYNFGIIDEDYARKALRIDG